MLGLGTQIKPHIERRFSMPWSSPAARMREYVGALRAIWATWQDGTPLRFEGEFYRHTLMTPMFSPAAHEWGAPPVHLAAVGPLMTRLAGEVADGLLAHGFTTERYLRERTLPALEEGLATAGPRAGRRHRQPARPGRDRPHRRARWPRPRRRSRPRSRSTAAPPPTGRCSSCTAGRRLADELHALSVSRREDKWTAMRDLVDDEVLGHVRRRRRPGATSAAQVRERYDGARRPVQRLRVLPGAAWTSGTRCSPTSR